MKRKKAVHRSFLIDGELIEEAKRVVPSKVADNLNMMVKVALSELVTKYKREAFEEDMARMAADPAVSRESKKATADFDFTDADGL